MLMLAGFSGLVGVLIGATSIGGVLLVPFLTYAIGLEVQTAIGAAMFAYMFGGVTGAVLYARRGSIDWRFSGWVVLGAMPAAFAGSLVKASVSGMLLEGLVACLLLFAGYSSLRPSRPAPGPAGRLSRPVLVLFGLVTGFASAMSGTGGPLVLLPMLLAARQPVLTAVGVAQAVQFPIALLASSGNLLSGDLDLKIGGVIAVALVLGVGLGAKLAHALSPPALRVGVSWLVIVVGAGIFAKLIVT